MFKIFRHMDWHDVKGWAILGVFMFANAFWWAWLGNRMHDREEWSKFVNGPMFVHQISPECKNGGCRFSNDQ